jgi:hypothetical protein
VGWQWVGDRDIQLDLLVERRGGSEVIGARGAGVVLPRWAELGAGFSREIK